MSLTYSQAQSEKLTALRKKAAETSELLHAYRPSPELLMYLEDALSSAAGMLKEDRRLRWQEFQK
jgi:hypothetical protein